MAKYKLKNLPILFYYCSIYLDQNEKKLDPQYCFTKYVPFILVGIQLALKDYKI